VPPCPGNRDHLHPFALYPALPGPSAGRDSRDYYECSVTMGLASGRWSRGTSSLYVSSAT